MNRHRVEQELDHQHSIVVARAFQTEGLGEDRSALLRNADPDINEGMVTSISFWPTDAFKTFLHLHYEQPFTYSETIDVLTNDRIPAEVPRYVVDVWEAKPDEQLARRILEAAHEHMENDPTNPPEIGTITSHPKCEGVPREDIIAQLEAMSKLSASINFKEGSGIIELDGAVDTVISEVDEIEADARPILDNAGLAVLPDDSAN